MTDVTTPASVNEVWQYAKTIAALIGAVLTSVAAALPVVPLWLTIGLAIVTAIAVFVIPNAPTAAQRDTVAKDLVSTNVVEPVAAPVIVDAPAPVVPAAPVADVPQVVGAKATPDAINADV